MIVFLLLPLHWFHLNELLLEHSNPIPQQLVQLHEQPCHSEQCHQTGEEGKKVERLYLEGGVDIKSEFYAAITLDRSKEMDVFMVSTEGGVEIEKVASETPEKIIKIWIDPLVGIKSFQIRKLAKGLGLVGNAFKEACFTFSKMYECYQKTDSSILEINPLVITRYDLSLIHI